MPEVRQHEEGLYEIKTRGKRLMPQLTQMEGGLGEIIS